MTTKWIIREKKVYEISKVTITDQYAASEDICECDSLRKAESIVIGLSGEPTYDLR